MRVTRPRRKCRIVQIESRASNTASKADYWVAPKPGTDAALALGIAHVIIKEDLYNKNFVEQNCFGFEDWSTLLGDKKHMGFKTMVLQHYSPSSVSKITGVAEKIIVAAGRKFAKSKAPIAIYGKGKDTLNGAVYEFMAVQSLNALVGNINKPGGVLLPESLAAAAPFLFLMRMRSHRKGWPIHGLTKPAPCGIHSPRVS